MCIYVYMYMCVCICIIYIYVHIHIYTYICSINTGLPGARPLPPRGAPRAAGPFTDGIRHTILYYTIYYILYTMYYILYYAIPLLYYTILDLHRWNRKPRPKLGFRG